MHGALGADPLGVHRGLAALHHAVVDAVLGEGRAAGAAEDPRLVRLVLDDEDRQVLPLAKQHLAPEQRVLRLERRRAARLGSAQGGLRRAPRPGPGVAEPERRQQVQRRRLRPAVVRGYPDQHVVFRRLRVVDEDIEVAVLVEHAGVQQLVFVVLPAAAAVLLRPGRS